MGDRVIRTSILTTFGFIMVVVGLVLTIYGQLAGRTCKNCEASRISQDHTPPHPPLPPHLRPHPKFPEVYGESPDFHPKRNDEPQDEPYSGDRIHQNREEGPIDQHRDEAITEGSVNKNAVKYSRFVGPVLLVLGCVFFVVSSLINRHSKAKQRSSSITGGQSVKLHWTEEVMQQQQQQQQQQHRNSSPEPWTVFRISTPESGTNAQHLYITTTPSIAVRNLELDNLPITSIIAQPPSYEESMGERESNENRNLNLANNFDRSLSVHGKFS